MAKARKVVGDQNSAELDHLKNTVNTLILMLESAAASITAGATAADVLNAWAAGISAGTDTNPNSIANISSTGRVIEGIWTTPTMPRRRYFELVTMTKDSKF